MSTEKIRELNNKFRETGVGGRVVMTAGIASLCKTLQFEIQCEVKSYNNFNKDNNPYDENSFGSINMFEVGKIFWKIDYYDKSLNYLSDDPADPEKTVRVLTIMLAEEY